jgi:hypothetical protein
MQPNSSAALDGTSRGRAHSRLPAGSRAQNGADAAADKPSVPPRHSGSATSDTPSGDHVPSAAAGSSDVPDLTLGGVAVLRWPTQADDRDRLAATGKPRLLVIEDGHAAPVVTDPLEDWIRELFEPVDLDNRLATLATRARRLSERPRFDADGLLWMGDRWVDIPDGMRRIADLLVARLGQIVRSDEIVATCSDAGISTWASAVKGTIRRLDQRFAQLGLELHNVRDRGYLLQVAASG